MLNIREKKIKKKWVRKNEERDEKELRKYSFKDKEFDGWEGVGRWKDLKKREWSLNIKKRKENKEDGEIKLVYKKDIKVKCLIYWKNEDNMDRLKKREVK